MRKKALCFMLIFLLGLSLASNLFAGPWPNLEKLLESYPGLREVQMQVEQDDLLGSSELLPAIKLFLKYGYAVRPLTENPSTGDGLLAEIRRIEPTQTLFVLRRASDGAIIAMEQMAKNDRLAVELPVPQQSAPPATPYYPATYQAPSRTHQSAPILLEDAPVSVVWLNESFGGGNLAMLSNAGVTLYQLQRKRLQKIAVEAPPRKGLRPLALSHGDVDGDGSFELAAIWAEDHSSIYEGTDSSIWSQLLVFEQHELATLSLQPGYVRLFPSHGVVQQRGAYSLFTGNVNKLIHQHNQVLSGSPLPWGGQNIFSFTPWGDGSGLSWQKPGRLAMISSQSGEVLPGGTLLEDLGALPVAQIAVRLENPEYRSGFEKEDKIMETYESLPPRLARYVDDSIVTIYRGRKEATLLFGQSTGADQLVRLQKKQGELILEYTFPPVQNFIVDFAVAPYRDGSEVLLLLNEKSDASGQAFLLYQHGN